MIAAAVLALGLTLGECALETAVVSVVPPSTFQVLATIRCGGTICFERWIQTDGKRLGVSRACETMGDRLSTGAPQ